MSRYTASAGRRISLGWHVASTETRRGATAGRMGCSLASQVNMPGEPGLPASWVDPRRVIRVESRHWTVCVSVQVCELPMRTAGSQQEIIVFRGGTGEEERWSCFSSYLSVQFSPGLMSLSSHIVPLIWDYFIPV